FNDLIFGSKKPLLKIQSRHFHIINKNGNNIKSKRAEQLVLRIDNKKICLDLNNLGCVPRKSLILKFPTPKQISHKWLRHFVRGYFDGDGFVYYNDLNRRKQAAF